jgi:hypothetical protein
MKNLIRSLLISSAIFFANFVHAQAAGSPSDFEVELQAIEGTTPTPAADVTEAGTFYSAQNPDSAPAPADVLGLNFWSLGDGFYVLDDRNINYDEIQASAQTAKLKKKSLSGSRVSALDDLSDDDFALAFIIPTNGLWLQITNVSNGLAYLNLMNATDSVYEIFSKTDLSATNWNIESEVFPTDTNAMPFIVPESNRTNLFIWARDWTGVTSGGNRVPDWWFYYFFGRTDLSDTNLDSSGDYTVLHDYTNSLNPNVILFNLDMPIEPVTSSPVSGSIYVAAGKPSSMAVLINDTNQTDAIWQSYNSNLVVNLDFGNGAYNIMVGLRGSPYTQPTWQSGQVVLHAVPLVLTITNPVASGTVSVPMIQVQGFANESLSNLTYDLSNAAGIFTNQAGYFSGQSYDTNLLTYTSNYFQCYDVPLTNGLNQITLHATDVAGTTAITALNVTLDYSGDHTAPVLSLVWPTNGTSIAGSNFTVQAQIDDATATVTATINSNTIVGIVERNGAVWFNNLPLNSGTNTVALTATDAAGNMSRTNIFVAQSAVNLSINPLTSSQMNQSSVTVSGTIGDASEKVIVNGVSASVSGNNWTASNVPVDPNGTASLNVQVTDSSNNPLGAQNDFQPQPSQVLATSYHDKQVQTYAGVQCSTYGTALFTRTVDWTLGVGGRVTQYSDETGPCNASVSLATNWNGIAMTGTSCEGVYSETLNSPWQFCSVDQSYEDDHDFTDCFGPDSRHYTFTRTADTKIEVLGGKQGQNGMQQLVLLKASASAYSNLDVVKISPFMPAYHPWPFNNNSAGDTMLPASTLLINGQSLTATATNVNVGETLISLPASGSQDIALTTSASLNQNQYSFNVQAQDVQLKIFAITNGTAIDLSTNTPEFCVGQQVTFMAQFDPPIDYSNVVAHWHLPDKYVNASSQNNPPFGSLHYFNDPDLLTNLTTSCWYVNGTGGTVSVGMDLLLPDGHSVPTAAKGNFTIYRPTFSDFTQQTFDLAWNFPQPLSWLEADMSWKVTVNSKYDGLYGITQLLLGTGVFYGTDGEYVLDGDSEIYGDATNGPSPYTVSVPSTHTLNFEDSPTAPTTSLDLDFEDYLRFQPSGTNNIYITIGKNGWSVNASYNVLTSTFTPTNIPSATRPVDNDEFPEWNSFRPGH